MQDGSSKQLVTDRIKNATNILVTVSANPSVDELSAALGLTLMLNKLDKHATAVFSGTIPPAISFLEPTKTFESTIDSLRDFIIALDKEKADRLRYKVEDDVVRIFITPYRTIISEKDLDFSQGDFNVELIIALGVEKREDLDKAIVAHGRILHDAAVVTINARDEKSSLGSVDWQDPGASSLCEMLVSISEALGSGLLDQQIASALLTGIVAATERFSNQHTSSRVMTMAAQLMAAGANQQLIATKLEDAHAIPSSSPDGSLELEEGSSARVKGTAKKKKDEPDGEMSIQHDPQAAAVKTAEGLATKAESAKRATSSPDEEKLSQQLDKSVASAPKSANLDQLKADLESEPSSTNQPSWKGRRIEPPTMGGTLSATSEEALQDKVAEESEKRNHKILSHDLPASVPPAFNNYSQTDDNTGTTVDLDLPNTNDSGIQDVPADLPPPATTSSGSTTGTLGDLPMPSYEPTAVQQPPPTLTELEAQAHAKAEEVAKPAEVVQSDVEQARAAVSDALGSPPLAAGDLGPSSTASGTPPDFKLPPLPDMSTLPPLPPPPNSSDDFPPPPLDTANPLPQASPLDQATEPLKPPADGTTDKQPPVPNDPSQFKIPGS